MVFCFCFFSIELDDFAGVADIIGRKYGSMKIPYNQNKSWAGSISMLVFGFLVSIGCVTILSNFSFHSLGNRLKDQLHSVFFLLYGWIYELKIHIKWEMTLLTVDI